MLTLPIEGEVETEHKVFRDFNMRQTVCLCIIAVIAIIMYVIFRNWMLMVGFTTPFALLLMYFAKPGENGEKAEEVLMKAAERHYYKNQTRVFQTKNQFIPLMNRAYGRMKSAGSAERESHGKRRPGKKN